MNYYAVLLYEKFDTVRIKKRISQPFSDLDLDSKFWSIQIDFLAIFRFQRFHTIHIVSQVAKYSSLLKIRTPMCSDFCGVRIFGLWILNKLD